MVLNVTFRFVTHLELIFMKSVNSVSRFFSCVCPIVQYHLLRIVSPLYSLCSFVKDHLL
jgi:hypothetical protein